MDQIRNQGPIGSPGDKLGDNEKKDFKEALSRLNSQPVGNLPDAGVGPAIKPGAESIFTAVDPNGLPGYGLDLNNNEQYDRGQDAVLGFDSNRDGKLDAQEIVQTNNILAAWGGDNDFNNDGKVDNNEQIQGAGYRARYRGMDKDHDGKLSNDELHQAGAKAWVDRDKDGKVDNNEVQSIDRVHTNDSLFPKKITEVDPNGKSRVEKQPIWSEKPPIIEFPGIKPKPPIWNDPGFVPNPPHSPGIHPDPNIHKGDLLKNNTDKARKSEDVKHTPKP